jgi:hypothetical protein
VRAVARLAMLSSRDFAGNTAVGLGGTMVGSNVRQLALLLLLGVAFATQGCAIIVRGDMQEVTLQSAVAEGIRVEVDGKAAKLGVVELDRSRIHVIRAEAPGHDPVEVTVHPFINEDWLFAEQCTMWPVLWLPMAVDYNSGSLHDFPATIDLPLAKSKTPDPATAGANAPSTAVPAAEVRETKIVLKKPRRQPTSVRESRTAHMEAGY